MEVRVYELRFFRPTSDFAAAEVANAPRVRAALDLTDAEALGGLLNRHLMAAAERAGLDRAQAHLFYLEVRAVDRFGGVSDREVALFQWALPVLPDEER